MPLRAFHSQVHGIMHENNIGSRRQDIIRRYGVGKELDLIPEPDNPYDSGAMKILQCFLCKADLTEEKLVSVVLAR
jgi:hypothetical protein